MESLFDDSSKPFYKFGDIIYLQRIPVEYWVKYITGKFSEADKTITNEQSEWIVGKVDGNSSYVQQLSWYVFQRTDSAVTDEILSDALNELIDQCREVFDSKTENLTAFQMNFLRAVADGVHTGFSSSNIIETYRLNSSANVAIVKKSLIDKELVVEENKEINLSDPVMGIWLQREF